MLFFEYIIEWTQATGFVATEQELHGSTIPQLRLLGSQRVIPDVAQL